MNVRNEQLMQRFSANPLKDSLAKALEVSERFAAASARIRANRDLNNQGKHKELEAQARLALRDLRDVRGKVAEMRNRRDQLNEGVQRKQFDKTDIVGAMNRAELRSVAASLTPVERMMLLRDPVFRSAMLEQPALVSGLKNDTEVKLYEDALKAEMAEMHGPRLQEIASLDETLEGAMAVLAIARNDVSSTFDIGDNQFEQFARPIESGLNAPWLIKDKDRDGVEKIYRITSVEPDFDGVSSGTRLATPDEIRDGKYYANHAEYLADRSAA